jgi:hypothetical protein
VKSTQPLRQTRRVRTVCFAQTGTTSVRPVVIIPHQPELRAHRPANSVNFCHALVPFFTLNFDASAPLSPIWCCGPLLAAVYRAWLKLLLDPSVRFGRKMRGSAVVRLNRRYGMFGCRVVPCGFASLDIRVAESVIAAHHFRDHAAQTLKAIHHAFTGGGLDAGEPECARGCYRWRAPSVPSLYSLRLPQVR